VLVFGDAHLGAAPGAAETDLLRFLRDVPRQARSLVIMGDLFDFWFGWRHVMPRAGFRVLAALADLHESGVPVLWIGGNHDCWGGESLESLTGARHTLATWSGDLGGWQARLAHGDGLREIEDAPYRRLRRVLRHPLAIQAYGLLHPDTATALARRSSHTSRQQGARGDEGRGLHAVAARWMEEPGAPELVVFGHSHLPALAPAGRGIYANAGAWFLDRQYLRVTEAEISRRRWTGATDGEVLAVLAREPAAGARREQLPIRPR
jgi:UDP-2,3-diacylglucosamine hydrolase